MSTQRRPLPLWLIIGGIIVIAAILQIIVSNTLGARVTAPHASIAAETIFDLGPMHFTNSMLTTLIGMALLVIFFAIATSKMSIVPSGIQNFAEAIIEAILGLVEGSAGRALGRKVFLWVATFFLFIITANWMNIIPGWETILVSHNGEQVPLLRPANADLNTTLAMAAISFCLFQYYSFRAHGIGGKLKEYINPATLGPLELVSELSRLISLSARLFGNVFGGSVLVTVMYFLLSTLFVGAFTFIFLGLELFFGLIQALLFSILTLSYIVLASAGGHHADEAHGGPDAPVSSDAKADAVAAHFG